MKKFFFDTGVKFENNPHLFGSQVWKNGTKQIPFYCEDVPENAKFLFACDNPDLQESRRNNVIVRNICNSELLSKFAYFKAL